MPHELERRYKKYRIQNGPGYKTRSAKKSHSDTRPPPDKFENHFIDGPCLPPLPPTWPVPRPLPPLLPSTAGSPMVWDYTSQPYHGTPMPLSLYNGSPMAVGSSIHAHVSPRSHGLVPMINSFNSWRNTLPVDDLQIVESQRECSNIYNSLFLEHSSELARESAFEFLQEVGKFFSFSPANPFWGLHVRSQAKVSVHGWRRKTDAMDILIIRVGSYTRIYPLTDYATAWTPVVTDSISLRSILSSYSPFEELRWLKPPWAAGIMQLLQIEIEQEFKLNTLNILQKLAKLYKDLPPQFYIRNARKLGTNAVSGGGFSDIWKGEMDNETVCLKVLRVFTSALDRDKLFQECCQEAVIWKQLNHPNILPFIGVNKELFSPSFCLISPWMSDGNIIEYFQRHPDRYRLGAICQIASAIVYIHSFKPPIVHGDIRGANILVKDGLCCLGDFGLSRVAETVGFGETYSLRGAMRWLAPEALKSQSHAGSDTWKRDIYAFGCTMYEIATLSPPFSGMKNDLLVMNAVLSGQRPDRILPNKLLESDRFWELIKRCWSDNVQCRPTAALILDKLRCRVSPLAHVLNCTFWHKGKRFQTRPPHQRPEGVRIQESLEPAHGIFYIAEFKAGRTNLVYGLNDPKPNIGDRVLVSGDNGQEIGIIITGGISIYDCRALQAAEGGPFGPKTYPHIIHLIFDVSIPPANEDQGETSRALKVCQTIVKAQGLPIDVVDVDFHRAPMLAYYYICDGEVNLWALTQRLEEYSF